jgi:3-carboxy-cis,cis-muconate cycloisomerase
MRIGNFYTRYWFSDEAGAIWSDTATLQAWLEVEATLAEAQADLGLVPVKAAQQIRACARAELIDIDTLENQIAFAQHPFVPVLKAFCAVCGDEASRYVHWGATTQNIFDTAQALQLRATVALVLRDLDQICTKLAELARAHVDTVQAGRTHGQHALPITFGLKAAAWKDELDRHVERLAHVRTTAFVARFGGAVGSYAAMAGRGHEVENRVAERLGLGTPRLGGRNDFDRQAELLTLFGMLVASIERIATDLLFLQRSEIGEIAEDHYEGRYGSSTMAQKRNPTGAQKVLGLCRVARARVPLVLEMMVREDEGDSVATNVNDYTTPEYCVLTVSVTSGLAALLQTVQVDSAAMARNVALSGGLISAEAVMMRLADFVGRDHAHEVVYQAARIVAQEGVDFETALLRNEQVRQIAAKLDLARLIDPANYVGDARAIVERVARAAPPTNKPQLKRA